MGGEHKENQQMGNSSEIKKPEFEELNGEVISPVKNIDLLMDIALDVVIELGRTTMPLKEVLELGPGAVIELDKLAGDPVDILVNDKLVARGEVVVIEENFGVRITEIVDVKSVAEAQKG